VRVKQAREKKRIHMGREGRYFLHANFWTTREEISNGKRTIHVVLEDNHYWVVFMLKLRLMCL
jgi:hypothetical protein